MAAKIADRSAAITASARLASQDYISYAGCKRSGEAEVRKMSREYQDARTVAELFPTQLPSLSLQSDAVQPDDFSIGAPFGPIPRSFATKDQRFDICQPLACEDEVAAILTLRAQFRVADYPEPYVLDIARAFRLLKGKKRYLEIGTFDRGNLAYVSTLLDADAVLIGVDTQDEPRRDSILKEHLRPGQTYVPIVGSSRAPETVEQVRRALGGDRLDAIFIDGDHTAFAVMCDYALYEQLVANDGIIFFHDSAWEGTPQRKGVADALDEINRFDPVRLIDGTNPCREFTRPMWRHEEWGVVGVVFAADQRWRQR